MPTEGQSAGQELPDWGLAIVVARGGPTGREGAGVIVSWSDLPPAPKHSGRVSTDSGRIQLAGSLVVDPHADAIAVSDDYLVRGRTASGHGKPQHWASVV
jgi:hypothetical protein